MIEGSGSVPLTNGFGSRRSKNIWIWIYKTVLKGPNWLKDPKKGDIYFDVAWNAKNSVGCSDHALPRTFIV